MMVSGGGQGGEEVYVGHCPGERGMRGVRWAQGTPYPLNCFMATLQKGEWTSITASFLKPWGDLRVSVCLQDEC